MLLDTALTYCRIWFTFYSSRKNEKASPSCSWLKQTDSKQTDGGETQLEISQYLKPKMYALFNHEIYSDFTGTYRAKIKSKPARGNLHFVDHMWLRAFLLDHWTYDTEEVRGHSLSSQSIGVAVIYVRRLSSGLIPCFNINQYNYSLKPDAASCVFSASRLKTESIRRGLIASRREFNFYFKFVIEFFYRSQCPRGLRHGSAAVRLLGLRVRIPPGDMDFFLLWVLCVVR